MLIKIWITVILTGIITQLFRISGIYIPIPRNKFMDKFLEAIPITVLVILFFPDILTSIGNSIYEILLAIFAIVIITILTIKKVDLGKIMLITVFTVIILNLIISKLV